MTRTNWDKVANIEFSRMPQNFQDDWRDLKEATE